MKKRLLRSAKCVKELELHQGDTIHLRASKDLFQVIGVDDKHERCWVRRWPLLPKGSPVFEISIQQIDYFQDQ